MWHLKLKPRDGGIYFKNESSCSCFVNRTFQTENTFTSEHPRGRRQSCCFLRLYREVVPCVQIVRSNRAIGSHRCTLWSNRAVESCGRIVRLNAQVCIQVRGRSQNKSFSKRTKYLLKKKTWVAGNFSSITTMENTGTRMYFHYYHFSFRASSTNNVIYVWRNKSVK